MNIYLTAEERALISSAAQDLGTTKAYVARLAIRKVLGLPIGDQGESEVQRIESGHVHSPTGHVQNLTKAGQ